MALKMQAKPEVVTTPVVEPVVPPQVLVLEANLSEVEALTSEYIELFKKFEYFEVKAMTKRMDEIRRHLQGVANETMEGTKPAVFVCAQGEIEFSERGKEAEIANPLALIKELLEKFGPEVTASVVSAKLTPLRKLLSEFELKKHLKEEPGGRTLRSVRPT